MLTAGVAAVGVLFSGRGKVGVFFCLGSGFLWQNMVWRGMDHERNVILRRVLYPILDDDGGVLM
jgi:hypothetical protein